MSAKKDTLTFPIWEKVYTELKDPEFFENIKGVEVKDKEVFIFPSTFEKSQLRKFFIFNIESETIREYEMEYSCFYPIYDKISKIYLFRIDDSFQSDQRYSVVEYNIDNREWKVLTTYGVAPKRRTDDFTAVYYQEKIFFFGGLQVFPADNSGSLLFSFNTANNEWSIENYVGPFPAPEPNKPYFGNRGGMVSAIYSGYKMFLIGGKVIENKFEDNTQGCKSFLKEVETKDLYELDLNNLEFTKAAITKFHNDTIKFYNNSSSKYRDYLYIYNKGNFYCHDFFTNEMTMIKPLLFNPESVKDTILITNAEKKVIYIIGRMKNFDDCIVFKTPLENLIMEWDYTKPVSYDNLLNKKEYSDSILLVDNREILANKILFFNLGYKFKTYISKVNHNNYIIKDSNYIAVYNLLKIIYNNFSETILLGIDFKIVGEVMIFLYNYQSFSLMNKLASCIKMTIENSLQLYDLALKLNLTELIDNCFGFIADNINEITSKSNLYESLDIRKLIYSNYFCKHKFIISANILGYNIKEMDFSNVKNEMIGELKSITRDTTLNFCFNCKKIINK